VSAIKELKALANPPRSVGDCFNCVLILLGMEPNWAQALKTMANPRKFINMLDGYDKDNVPKKLINKLKPII